MSKVKAEYLMDLLHLPMTDNKVVEMLDKLGAKQPIIGEEYYDRGRVSVDDEENSGAYFVFSELDGYSSDGEPILIQIDFLENHKVTLPFDLDFYDNYEMICRKIEKKADLCNKRLSGWRQWIILHNDIEMGLIVHFSDKELSTIDSIVISQFERDRIEKSETLFYCNEE